MFLIPLLIIPGPWSPFWLSLDLALLFHCCQLEQLIASSNQRALLVWRAFHYLPDPCPWETEDSLWVGFSLCIGSSGPLRRESPVTTTPLFPLTKEVLMWGSQKDLHPSHQLSGLLVPEPHICCRRCQSHLSDSEEEEKLSSWYMQWSASSLCLWETLG